MIDLQICPTEFRDVIAEGLQLLPEAPSDPELKLCRERLLQAERAMERWQAKAREERRREQTPEELEHLRWLEEVDRRYAYYQQAPRR